MIDISQKKLITRFNTLCYTVLSDVYYQSQAESNQPASIGPIDFFLALLEQSNTDLHCLLPYYDLSLEAIKHAGQAFFSAEKTSSVGMFEAAFLQSLEDAWMYTSLVYQDTQMRSGIWLLACLKHPDIKRQFWQISSDFKSVPLNQLEEQLLQLCETSCETFCETSAASALKTQASDQASALPEVLSTYTENLTQAAAEGRIDAIVGRDSEIRQVLDIVMRRRQNNPILVGEAGVGKTAIAEGLAWQIYQQYVPEALQTMQVLALDLSALQAGASMKGEFEKRLKALVNAIESSPKPIILFIDEAHTLIGAGGHQGTGDAANILKPALARGQLRCLAATTWSEYKQFFEKDTALTRRFQLIKVEEPSVPVAIEMLREMRTVMKQHHQVTILEEAFVAAVEWSDRFIPARQLPDKAVSVLDTACARVASSQQRVPATIEDLRAEIQALQTQQAVLAEETQAGVADISVNAKSAFSSQLTEQQGQLTAQLKTLEAQWQTEQQLVEQILELRSENTQHSSHSPSVLERIQGLLAELASVQGDQPMVLAQVDAQVVAAVVADWTGIPVGQMLKDEIRAVLDLEARLQQNILGQQYALKMISRRIQTSQAQLADPNKPIGVFLLLGPSGVGKTETACALAEHLFGSREQLITINMSEFQEAHSVSTLKGSPPGYVGYGEGGGLTEAVRRKPYSVVLLDEIEKAHPDVHQLFFQVFDKGIMEDGEGRQISFKNALILLTSNLGSETLMQAFQDQPSQPQACETQIGVILDALKPQLLQAFPAALLGRMVMVPYAPLTADTLDKIIRLALSRIIDRMAAQHRVTLTYADELVAWIAKRCEDWASGGRMIDNILTNSLLPELSRRLLNARLEDTPLSELQVRVHEDQLIFENCGAV